MFGFFFFPLTCFGFEGKECNLKWRGVGHDMVQYCERNFSSFLSLWNPNPPKHKPVISGCSDTGLAGGKQWKQNCNLWYLRPREAVGHLFLTPTTQYCSSLPQLCFVYACYERERSLTLLNSPWSEHLPQGISTCLKLLMLS